MLWGLLGKGFEQIKKSVNLEIKEDFYKRAPLQANVVDKKLFIGFEKERDQICDELSNPSKTGRKIVGIIGMPGIGKTTLARKLYDDPFIIGYFDERAWCVVSQTYNKRRVLTEIFEGLTSMPDKDSIFEKEDENVLLEVMHKTLKWRRYLIVIDDVWDSEFWNDFGRYFPVDGKGSRIVLTSRNIVGAPRESIIHQLPLMTEDQCWELLTKKLFQSAICPGPLLKSGKRIAAKCNGLPLLVDLLAGIFSKVGMEQSEWEVVELSLDSHTSKGMEIVELSYKHLPDHLKLCFLYLGVFPQGSEIQVQKLTWLWTAEGFIEKREEESVEHVAKEYLRNLIDRSLLLTTKSKSTGKAKACRVHDLVRDMCLRKVQEQNFLTLVTDDFFMSYNKHQRLCVSSATQDYLIPFSMHCRSYFSNPSDTNLSLPQMKLLKVMELSWRWNYAHHFHRYMAPRIDQLIHLRYLVIDQLKDVPEQILGNLVNLEFLHVDSDSSFALPSAILNMEKLRHVLVKPYAEFGKHCNIIFQNKIESIETIEINNNEDFEILKGSPNLHKLKCRCLSLAHDFGFFINLQSLKISVPFYHLSHRDSYREIHLPAAIRKLSLDETRLPWENISILGKLPKLEVLKLRMHAFEGETWETIDGEFQNLRILKLIGLNLEEWSIESSEHFPKLERLLLNRCFGVHEIPIELGDSTTLEMIEVYYCSTEVSNSALSIQEYQYDNGIEDLTVIIKNQRESNNETDNIHEDFLDLEAQGQTSKEEMMMDVFQRHGSRQGIRALQLPPKELISALINFEKSRRRGFRENWDALIGVEVEYTIIDSGE